jgi:hypothetical protein
MDLMIFLSRIKSSDENKTMDIIDIMAKTGKIDKELWEKYKVIASQDFLDSIEDAYKRRGNKIITMGEIKAIFTQNENSGVSDTLNPDKVELMSENDDNNLAVCELMSENNDNNPQTKLKETKLKETKLNPCDFDDCKITDPQKMFLHYWQHAPDIFNITARIGSPKEWENYWKTAPPNCEQVKTAMENFIADVRCGAIELRYVPKKPDRFVLNGWIITCQKRRNQDKTEPSLSPHKIGMDNVPENEIDQYFH